MPEKPNSAIWVAIRRIIWRLDHLVSGGGSSAAPSDSTYLLKTADAALPNAYTLADGNGIKTTWAGNVATPAIYIASQANGDLLYFDGTWKRLGIGGAGNLLTVNGGLPAWAAFTLPTPATTVTDETGWGVAPAVGTGTKYARDDHTHGTPTNPVTAHVAAADPHAQYQLESEKGAANGYAGLDAGSLVPVANLGTGAPTGAKFLRDDRTWQVPGGGGTMDHAALTSNLNAGTSGHVLAAGAAGRLWGFDAAGAYTSYVIGTHVQAYDAGLLSLTGADTAFGLAYPSAANTWSLLAGAGHALEAVRVNAAANALEFFTPLAAGPWTTAGLTGTNGYLAGWSGGVPVEVLIDTDGTMAANSDARVPSQKAVKTYVGATAQPVASYATALMTMGG